MDLEEGISRHRLLLMISYIAWVNGILPYQFRQWFLKYKLACDQFVSILPNLRGRGGRISRLPLAWKAATRIEPGRTSFANAFRTVCLERTDAAGLLMAGKLEAGLVEKARLDAAFRQDCRSIVGRTIEAIAKCPNWILRRGELEDAS